MSAAAPSPEFLALQQAVAGRFSLVRELGRGGMGIVFLARDLSLERLVAIKLLPPALGGQAEARDRFVREARTAAALSHPHIVPIHLVEARGALVYFVMAFVDGETLGERVRRRGALPAAEAMRIVQEVAWALGHAHANGIVHSDVKPDNILLESSSGRAMVSDFGIARSVAQATPVDGVARGTPQYASPEVLQGGKGDARSDLYSLGITAWMAAAGRHPFGTVSTAALVLAHVHGAPPSLAGAARVPARFGAAVDRCLRKDPSDRWANAEAFAAEIDAARARVPAVAAPVRAFLREWSAMSGEVGTALTAALVASAEAIALPLYDLATRGSVGFDSGILSWIFLIIAVLTAGLGKARLVQLIAHARAMLRAGYSHARIAAAQAVDDADRADEIDATDGIERSQRRERLVVLGGAILGTVGAFALAYSDLGALFNAAGAAGAVALPTLAIRTAQRLNADSAREPLTTRILRGRLGRWVFRLAGMRLGPTSTAAVLEGPEPTALALGHAARDLHSALPPAVRAALPADIPELLGALEATAMRARVRDDDPRAAEVFSHAVSAIESIRLDLLRLSVNAMSPAELTADLGRVRALGAAVDRQLSAAAEVEQLLAPTPPASPTPSTDGPPRRSRS